MMREEELVFIGMKEPEQKPKEIDPMCRQDEIRERRKVIQAQNKDEYEEALVNIRRKIYDDEGVDMREQVMITRSRLRTFSHLIFLRVSEGVVLCTTTFFLPVRRRAEAQ
jgi:hypothetical protein